MKCALSALQYLKDALQEKNTTVAATRFREGCHQIAKGLIEAIPLIGTVCMYVIHSNLNNDLVNEGVRLVKEGQIDRAIALEERILFIWDYSAPECCLSQEFLLFGRIYHQILQTNPDKAEKLANSFQKTWSAAYEDEPYTFQRFTKSISFKINISGQDYQPKPFQNRKYKPKAH